MHTHITFVLDSSGSMATIEDDTIGGFNAFLEDQRTADGTATVSLYDFDTSVTCVYAGRPVEDAPQLTAETYLPGGQTALHDAIHTATVETAADLAMMDAEERPETVIVVVLTDGKENASETPQKRVREQVESRQTEFDWEYLFIGANQDAALTAGRVGINRDQSLNMAHDGEGARAAYESTSERISQARKDGTMEGYTDEDRERQNRS
jgi:hypothetical protein